ncbi:uncharacterized conserved protein [Longilinea arvoryzae]|uniref:Uncharacterized conserved protein n=1 Tax=Longilinea arvoryzae TaxID=360412 RepID=A0A0S7BC34_9CHLR|nr:toxin-antitoxin system HicB family antitoxin [Longilinea arvoryzae]GAP12845.1 uncharacterized conserved protein [Longilinea arvoryzae]
MNKNIEYYLGLPYTRELIPEASGIWFARVKELPNCMSQGNSPEEALHNLNDAMYGWIKGELEDGEPIPEPREEEEYSGKFNTRVPKALHRKLVEAADRDRVSLNQWINTALAEAVGESTAQFPANAVKAEEVSTTSTWPGISSAIQHILHDVGMGHEAGVMDERLFANWLDQNLYDIQIDCEKRNFEQALAKAKALSELLKEHWERSPILRSLSQFLMEFSELLELNCDMNQKVLKAEQMREQIGMIVGAINHPIQSRMQILEKSRFSATTSMCESETSNTIVEPVNKW